ncbi:MAG: transposase, partial [Elusimicrobiota bacterium]
DDEEDKKYGFDKRGTELPENIQDKEQRIKKMKQIVEQLKQARQKIKESGKKKINLTDEDAQFQKDKTRKIPGYRGHIAVDSKEQVIVANDVTNQARDSVELIPMIDEVLDNVEEIAPDKFKDDRKLKEKINIPADSGYSSGNNFAELDKEQYKNKIEPFIPDEVGEQIKKGKGGSHKEDPQFDKSKFIYNSEDDTVTCPAGKKLHHTGKRHYRGVMYNVYGNNTYCKSCQHYGKCTSSKCGRNIFISEHQPLFDKMRSKLLTPEGKKIYGIRKITAEPVFGNLAHNLGFREFLLRGLEKVKGEFSLMCSAHNLLKITRFLREQKMLLTQALAKHSLFAIPDG